MKRILCLFALCASMTTQAQDLNDIFISGLEDAERFANDYTAPAAEALMFNLANGWYNSGQAKKLGGFEISIVGNTSFFKNMDNKTGFILDPSQYENLRFRDGDPLAPRRVSSALGDIEGVFVVVDDGSGLFNEEFELPSGLLSEGINFVPTGFLQASVGLIKGTEIKARFVPKISIEDEGELGLFGVGIQHDFTSHLPADKVLPIAISGVIGYTNVNFNYEFTESSGVTGSDQRVESDFGIWTFSAVASTKLPVINFYGGLNYISGKAENSILGQYTVQEGPFQTTYTDPFVLETKVNAVSANIGTKLKLGFFRINVDYNISEFSTLTAAVNFGFR